MKSFCLSLAQGATLRETLPGTPHPSDSNGRQQGYSANDIETLNEVCVAIDKQVGPYRKARREVTQAMERAHRQARKIEDREKREYRQQLATDEAIEQIEAIDAEHNIERKIVVSLETAEMKWLQDNWAMRTDWNGADEVRPRLRAIRSALKDENLIEWKAGETEPDAAAFERVTPVPTPIRTAKEQAPSTEASATAAG